MDAATGVILIAKQAGIVCANEVDKISKTNIREKAKAVFYSDSIKNPKICNVTDYILHPEYGNATSNTFAIVKLENNDPTFEWKCISWPKVDGPLPKIRLFAIGFSDENKIVEQLRYSMVQVDRVDCLNFYTKEGMTFKELWPSHFECYKRVDSNTTCVDDAGMALVRRNGNQSILIGMSTYGPGCLLPARYIRFAPYMAWIKNTLNINTTRSGYKELNGFRRVAANSKPYFRNLEEFSAIPDVKYEDTIQMHLNKIRDEELVMQLDDDRIGYSYQLMDNCSAYTGHRLAYVEEGYFNVGHGQSARIIYAVSLYDLRFSNITCIRAWVNSTSHSNITVNFGRGFAQDDIDPFVQRIPIKSPLKVPAMPVRVLDMTSTYAEYRNIIVTSAYFRFDFTTCAAIRVEFWGLPWTEVDTEIETTTPKQSTTTRTYTSTTRAPPKPRRRFWGQEQWQWKK